jgi:hypothetical protein
MNIDNWLVNLNHTVGAAGASKLTLNYFSLKHFCHKHFLRHILEHVLFSIP